MFTLNTGFTKTFFLTRSVVNFGQHGTSKVQQKPEIDPSFQPVSYLWFIVLWFISYRTHGRSCRSLAMWMPSLTRVFVRGACWERSWRSGLSKLQRLRWLSSVLQSQAATAGDSEAYRWSNHRRLWCLQMWSYCVMLPKQLLAHSQARTLAQKHCNSFAGQLCCNK